MSSEPAPQPKPPVGAVLLLLFAAFFYALMLLCFSDLRNSGNDAAGRGMAAGFGFVFGAALWLILGLLLLIGGVNGRMPDRAAAAAAILWPLSGLSASVALDFIYNGEASYFVVPAALPPVIAGYALWARVSSWHQALPPAPISLIAWIAVALLSLAPVPRYALQQMHEAAELRARQAADAAKAAQEAERRRQNIERFSTLTAASPLWDWAPFFGAESELDARAIAAAKALPHRQEDAEAALRRGMGFPLVEYQRLDLAATPGFCSAADDFLGREAAARRAPGAETEYDTAMLPSLEANDIGAVEWLTAHCDIGRALAQIRSTIGTYKPTHSRDATLALIEWRRGNGLRQKHDLAGSLQAYDEAVRLNPGQEQFRKSRGDVYFDLGRYDDALADYDESIRLNPGSSEAYYSRGNTYDRQGEDDKAIASFAEAIRIAPEYAAAYNNRGLVYIRQGRLDLALQDYDTALQYAPSFRLAHDNRGRVRFFRGAYAEAAEDFAAALSAKPDEPYTVLLLYLARLHADQDVRDPDARAPEAQARFAADAAGLDRAAWPYPIVAALLGGADAAAVRDAAATDKGQACEADFYFGDKAAAEGDAAKARPLLQRALSGCPADYLERMLAKYELTRLPN